VFDAWPFEQATYQRIRTTDREYVVVGCPKWLAASRPSSLRKTLTAEAGHQYRPDVVWEAADRSFVIELKSAAKYEPLALPEVLHHARSIARASGAHGANDVRPVVPVMVTQYNAWLREALEFLFDNGLRSEALHYLEFELLNTSADRGGTEQRILWLDEPFAPWVQVDPPAESQVPRRALGGMFSEPTSRWYRIDATDTWVVTEPEHGVDVRPSFVEGRYGMVAPAGPRSLVCWTGSRFDAGVYQWCELDQPPLGVRVATPRLARPEQVKDFNMSMESEGARRA